MRIYNILLLACILFAAQGCIKVESELFEEVCRDKQSKPILTEEGQTLTAEIGTYFGISVQNYFSYYTSYHIYSPSGKSVIHDTYNSTLYVEANSSFEPGRYGIVAKDQNDKCTSDTAFIYLQANITEPQCGLPDNAINIYNNSVYSTGTPTRTYYGSYYQVNWALNGSTTSSVKINFGKQPNPNTTQWYNIEDVSPSTLRDDEASISVELNGSPLSGHSGYLVTLPSSDGKVRVKMCSATLYSSSYGLVSFDANMLY